MTQATIMIVEDEAVIGMEIRTHLLSMNYAVASIVHTGLAAIDKAKQDRPDLILMDIHLKGQLDGIDTAAEIRAALNIPIIYLTAYADDNLLQRAKQTRPYGYVLKPFTRDDLKVAIELALHIANLDHQRRQAEEKLCLSENKLRSLVEQSADGVMLADEQGRIVEWNPSLERVTGLPRSAVLGQDVVDVQHHLLPAARQTSAAFDKTKEAVRQALQTGHTPWFNQIVEEEFQHPDGTLRTLQIVMFPIQTEQGFMLGSINRDVTAQKQVEQTLKIRERYLTVVVAIQRLLLSGDKDVYQAVLKYLGSVVEASRAQILKNRVNENGDVLIDLHREWYAPDLPASLENGAAKTIKLADFAPAWREALRQDQPVTGDHKDLPAAARRLLQMEDSGSLLLLPLRVKNELWGFLSLTDADARRRWETVEKDLLAMIGLALAMHLEQTETAQALRESESRQRALLEAVPDMIIRYDRSGVALDFKLPTYFPSLTPPEEILGRNVTEFLPPDLAKNRQMHIKQALGSGQIQVYEQQVQFPDRVGYEEVRIVASGENEAIAIIRDITERHEAQLALTESEERYRIVSELVTDYVYALRIDPSGQFELIWATAAYMELIGPLTEFTPTSEAAWLTQVHPADRSRISQVLEKVIKAGQAYENEYRIFNKDGHLRWLHDTGRPVNWQGPDQPFLIYGASKDITGQRMAEENLRQRDELLRKLSEQVPGMIYQYHLFPDGRSCFPYTTDAIRRIYEVTPEQVRHDASDVFTVIHPDDYDAVVESISVSAKTLTNWVCDYRVALPQRGVRWLHGEAAPEMQADGSIIWHGSIHDVTERKQTEETLRFETHLNKSLAHLAAEILASDISIERVAAMVHRLALELTGSRYGFVSSIDPVTGDNVAHTLSEMMAQSNVEQQSIILSQENGHYPGLWGFPLNTRQPFFTNTPAAHPAARGIPAGHIALHNFLSAPAVAKGQLMGQIALANADHAYTQKDAEVIKRLANVYALAILRKRYEDELIVAKEKTEAANRAKSDFLANMSHELRTPLNAIMGYAQILQNDQNLTTSQQHDLETIYRSGEHLLTLITDILDLAKIEAGRTELHLAEFHFSVFLQNLVDMFNMRTSQVGIEFIYQAAPNLPTGIVADERRLRQILINLLGNAVKFTPQGQVTFRVEAIDRPDKESAYPRTTTLRFEVTDTGCGIPPDRVGVIFEPFRQVEGPERFVEGTGLGLAISQRLAALMGGEIQVESRLGQGSRFWLDVTVPVTVRHTDITAKSEQRTTAGQITNYRVLVVDDVLINQKLLAKVLTKHGLEVVTAVDGLNGLEQAQQHRPDIILTDVRMPVMDGLEMTRQLRQMEQFKETIIIAVSAGAFDQDRADSLAAGCDEYLVKPINVPKLLDLLAKNPQPNCSAESQAAPEAQPPGEMRLPAPEIVANLFELADAGDFRGVLEKLSEIEQTDAGCPVFITELRDLAERFEVDVLRLRIEQFLEKGNGAK